MKIGNSIGEMFETSIGTPQGDTLSPILFLIYLEHIMRTIPAGLAREDRDLWVAYADDVEAIMRKTREEIQNVKQWKTMRRTAAVSTADVWR